MHFDQTFWVGVAFIIFVALIYKPVGRLIGKGLDVYARRIRKELDEALKLKEKAQEVLASYEREHRNASKEIEKILAYAREEAERITISEKQKLEEAIKKRTEMALQKIAQAEASVLKELQDNAADMTISAARALIAEHLSKEAAEELIAKSLFDIERKFH
ncbi:MAG: F0F1 ATP synthase subunit B [Hyphomicrobiales bacterium]|nr:ATP F0F1 synthase subunit B [Rickettsiales bacterium]MCP5362129.1 F0F1 ATP synthase subunit B [Hyphomicrobiales bacterium]